MNDVPIDELMLVSRDEQIGEYLIDELTVDFTVYIDDLQRIFIEGLTEVSAELIHDRRRAFSDEPKGVIIVL